MCDPVTTTCWKNGTLRDSGAGDKDAPAQSDTYASPSDVEPFSTEGGAESAESVDTSPRFDSSDSPLDSTRDQAIADRPDAGPECADGGCSTCVEGVACDRRLACKLGQTSCATGVSTCVESGNADDGTPCGSGQVCSVGQCVPCSAGAGCVPTNACHQGTLSCTGGVPVCTDLGTPLDEGAKCGTDKVCHQGTCLTCKAGATCDVTGAPCRVGQTSCNTGQAVCIESGNAANGKACGTGMVCNSGECKACNSGSPCVPTNPCHVGTLDCSAGTATCTDTSASVQDGTGCGTNLVCLSGACVACTGSQDCTPVGTTCKVGKTSCASGTSVCVQNGNAADGSGCGSKQVCSKGACVSCAGGSPCAPTTAPCHTGSLDCSAGTPVCTDLGVNLGNGTSCGTDRVCSGGSCVACKTGDVCTPSNPCQTGTTDCSTGTSVCTPTGSVKDGTANCGTGQVCRGGACVACTEGTSCTPTTAICHKGTQSCATGAPVCTDTGTNATNGTNCGTNLGCANGTCSCTQGTVCTPPGQPCKVGTTDCSTGSSVCNVTGSVPNQPAVDCDAGKICVDGTCVVRPGCGSTPALGCPCSSPGTLACNGAHQALRLKCTAGVWVDNTTCLTAQNCDQSDGLCHAIIANCQTSTTYCSDGNTQQTCNADLTATTPTACVGVCSSNTCQTARCGDTKVESSIGEECDDGNTVASDGCEPDCKLSKVVAVAAGAFHSCVLLSSGSARCWGDNQYSQLGLGDTAFHGTTQPSQLGPITFGERATAIASGLYHVCVVLASGGVRCWGRNEMGQLGQGDNTTTRTTPAPAITFNSPVRSIAAGGETTCVILQNGDVHCWGANGSGMLGLGTITEPSQGTAATALGAIAIGGAATAISVGTDAVCASRSSGVICWGYNGSGQLGRGDTVDVGGTGTPAAATPPAIPVLASGRTATALASGAGHTCALQDNNQLECWGSNAAGQLGLGLPASGTSLYIGDNEAPATSGVLQLTGVTSIYAANSSTCAGLQTGGLRCWGLNTKGELGYADISNKGNDDLTKPLNLSNVAFGTGVTATSVAIGNAHTCALLSNGQVRCWGRDNLGQLGNGTVLSTAPDYVGGNSLHTPDLLPPVQVFPPSP